MGGVIDGEAAGDRFGNSGSMSGDGRTIIAGASQNDRHRDGSGCAGVFKYGNGARNQLDGVINGQAAGDQFGRSTAMSEDGRTTVVGAIGNDSESGQV